MQFVFFKISSFYLLEQDLIGLDASGQVVFHSALVDVDEELHLSKAMLRR